MAKIVKRHSILIGGREITLFRISNASGAYVELTNIGASIVSIVVPDRKGAFANVALRYDDLMDYLDDEFYLGATVGRVSNRITDACFTMEGITYNLDRNDGENSNHGGYNGLNRKIFDFEVNKNSLTFHTVSLDGEGGFPGNLKVRVTYSFSDANELRIEYVAVADERTPISLTNHTYFNLSGKKNTILNHLLHINAGQYLETNSQFLPTGHINDVQDTEFDFRESCAIQKMPLRREGTLKGYNTYFICPEKKKKMATVKDPASGRMMCVYSTMPGILLYTGDFLEKRFIAFQGLCLEAQYYPDAVNHESFEAKILEPGKVKTDSITYVFGVENNWHPTL